MRIRLLFLSLLLSSVGGPSIFGADAPSNSQSTPIPRPTVLPRTKPADPAPLPMPSMAGPLQTAVPHEVENGKLAVTGILTGIGWSEGNHVAG